MDLRFLYNRYILRIRRYSGESYRWSFCLDGVDRHEEPFIEPFILKKGQEFVDIGANVGAWTIRAAPYYRQITAFEPNPVFAKHLRSNLRLNKVRNVQIHEVALGNYEGFTFQPIRPPARRPGKNLAWTRHQVPTGTLDAFRLSPSIIKLDVEGVADDIVRGGQKTILTTKPMIIVEVHSFEESQIPSMLPQYSWQKFYRDMPEEGDWLWRESGRQLFLVGSQAFPPPGKV